MKWLCLLGCLAITVVAPCPPRPVVVLVSMDGFRWDYAYRGLSPFLDNITTGVHRLKPSYPSKTFPNHNTLVTGLYPESHGIVSNHMYDPTTDTRWNLGDCGSWWEDGEPVWVLASRLGLPTAAFFWPGSECTIRGHLPTIYRKYDPTVSFKDRVDTVVNWITEPCDTRPMLILMYFDEPDHSGHMNGPHSPETDAAVVRVDNMMRYLVDSIHNRGMSDEVNLLFVTDHGMAALSPDRVVCLHEHINISTFRVEDGTPLLSIWPYPGMYDIAYSSLRSVHSEGFIVYSREDMPNRLHYRHHRRIAPILGVVTLGWAVAHTAEECTKYRGPHGLKGTHGFDNDRREMHGMVRAMGPSFTPGVMLEEVPNVDIYPLLCELVGLPPASNNGSLDRTRSLLRAAPASDDATGGNSKSYSAWKLVVLLSVLMVVGLGVLVVVHDAPPKNNENLTHIRRGSIPDEEEWEFTEQSATLPPPLGLSS